MAASHSSKVVAAGVRREEGVRGYWLNGKREDLLRSGLVREAWFPCGERNGRGQLARTKYSKVDDGEVCCRYIRSERYEVLLPYPASEVERREAERVRPQQLQAKLAALPHFDPETDSLSNRELLVVRIIRALDDRGWRGLAAVIPSLLEGLPDIEVVAAPATPRLRLVIDNTK